MSVSTIIRVRLTEPGTPRFTTREEWLMEAAVGLTPLFASNAIRLPEGFRVSCGFPRWSRGASHAIGQCWPNRASGDGSSEIFISPSLDDPMKVSEVLARLSQNGGVFLTQRAACLIATHFRC